MTPATNETAGGRGGDGEGLLGSPMNARTQGILADNMAGTRPATRSTEQRECLPIPRSVIESSERLTVVVSHSPSGKSRLERLLGTNLTLQML